MSILTNKHILLIGEESTQVAKVESALVTYGASVTKATCEETTVESLQHHHTQLIFLNHVDEHEPCRIMLEALQEARVNKEIPIFALVQNNQVSINEVLMLGAADYVTPNEDPHTIVEKIKQILGESGSISGESAIDLTPKSPANGSAGIRVFAIEDDQLLRNLLAIRFEKSQLQFEIAQDGINVVEKIVSFQPQIIILDLMLPGISGFDVLRSIKSSEVADVPVIIFSNKDSQTDRDQVKKLGAAAFYVKAMTDLSELVDIIQKYAKQ